LEPPVTAHVACPQHQPAKAVVHRDVARKGHGSTKLTELAERGGHVDFVEVGKLDSHQEEQALRVALPRNAAVQRDGEPHTAPCAPAPAPADAAAAATLRVGSQAAAAAVARGSREVPGAVAAIETAAAGAARLPASAIAAAVAAAPVASSATPRVGTEAAAAVTERGSRRVAGSVAAIEPAAAAAATANLATAATAAAAVTAVAAPRLEHPRPVVGRGTGERTAAAGTTSTITSVLERSVAATPIALAAAVP